VPRQSEPDDASTGSTRIFDAGALAGGRFDARLWLVIKRGGPRKLGRTRSGALPSLIFRCAKVSRLSLDELVWNARGIVLVGRIDYEDAFKKQRWTEFCFSLSGRPKDDGEMHIHPEGNEASVWASITRGAAVLSALTPRRRNMTGPRRRTLLHIRKGSIAHHRR